MFTRNKFEAGIECLAVDSMSQIMLVDVFRDMIEDASAVNLFDLTNIASEKWCVFDNIAPFQTFQEQYSLGDSIVTEAQLCKSLNEIGCPEEIIRMKRLLKRIH